MNPTNRTSFIRSTLIENGKRANTGWGVVSANETYNYGELALNSAEVGASVEEQLRLEGKQWTRINGEITVGAYVEDILDGRLDQPDGRGSVGLVVSLLSNNSQTGAMVDFGRGYTADIYLTELSLLRIEDASEPSGGSVEEQLRLEGKKWTRIAGEITVGAYVEDVLEGRLNQPVGRGSLGRVVSLLSDDGQLAAMVDFGLGYTVGIYLAELSLLRIEDAPAVSGLQLAE